MAIGHALLQLRRIWQEFNLALQARMLLQISHQFAQSRQVFHHIQLVHCQHLRLQIIVAQNQMGHIIGHGFEQIIAVFNREFTRLHNAAQQNFDVDLVVGAIHTCRIVHRIGVTAATALPVFDARQLRHAQITAFAYDFGSHFIAIHAHHIVGLVHGIGVGFGAGFDVSTNAAVVQQLNFGL